MEFRNWLLVEEIFANNSATIYHRTGKSGENPQEAIEGIFTSGFRIGQGDAYGPGLYSTLNLEDQLSQNMTGYGKYLVKLKADDVKKYLVFIPSWARKIFKDDQITLTKQIKLLGININSSDDELKKIDDRLGFTPGKVEVKVVGEIAAAFIHKYVLYDSTTNCKGVIYNDNHGYVLLFYPPIVNVTPIAWAEVIPGTIDPKQIEWHNMRNLALVNFPEKSLEIKARKVAYKVPEGLVSKKGQGKMTSKEFVAFVNDVKNGKKFTFGSYEDIEELEEALKFLSEKNLSVNLVFSKISDSSIQIVGSKLFKIISEYSKNSLDNNNSIIKILNVLKDPRYSSAGIAYALADRMTSKPDSVRNYILSNFEKAPSITEVNYAIKNNNISKNEAIKIIEDLIERASNFGKTVDISNLVSINPRLYIKISAKDGTITPQNVSIAFSYIQLYNKQEMEDLLKFLEELNNPIVYTQGKAYQEILPRMLSHSYINFDLESIEKLIPQQEIKDYFNDPQNSGIDIRAANSARKTETLLLIKYKDELSDNDHINIIENLPNFNVQDSVDIVKALINKKKSKNELMTFKDLKEILNVCDSLASGGKLVLEVLPDEYFANLNDEEVKYILNKIDSFETEKMLANKIASANNKISDNLKDYITKLTNSDSQNSPLLMPTVEDIELLFGDKFAKVNSGRNISNMIQSLRIQVFKDKNKEQKDIDEVNSLFEKWMLNKINQVDYTNYFHNAIMDYLPNSLSFKKILMNLPDKALEMITKDYYSYGKFKNLISNAKAKLSQSDLDELSTHFVSKFLQNDKLKSIAKTIPLIFGKKGTIYQ